MQTIMRYLNASKALRFIDDKRLYFSPAIKQNDPNEGNFESIPTQEELDRISGLPPVDEDAINELMKSIQQIDKGNKFLNCWTLNDSEDHQMWESYGKNGIVLISNKLCIESSIANPLPHAIITGNVEYSDEKRKTVKHMAYLIKEEKFSFEKEYRLIFDPLIYALKTGFIYTKPNGDKVVKLERISEGIKAEHLEFADKVIGQKGDGYLLDFDVSLAFIEIRIHPLASDDDLKSFTDALRKIGVTCPINHSELREPK